MDTAAEVQAPTLQLRAALRLARLWREQGKTEPAQRLLSDAYEQLTHAPAVERGLVSTRGHEFSDEAFVRPPNSRRPSGLVRAGRQSVRR